VTEQQVVAENFNVNGAEKGAAGSQNFLLSGFVTRWKSMKHFFGVAEFIT
jgi:hypothetical protein